MSNLLGSVEKDVDKVFGGVKHALSGAGAYIEKQWTQRLVQVSVYTALLFFVLSSYDLIDMVDKTLSKSLNLKLGKEGTRMLHSVTFGLFVYLGIRFILDPFVKKFLNGTVVEGNRGNKTKGQRCANTNQCRSGLECKGRPKTCQLQKKANGKPCGGDGECQSGHCIGRGNNKKCGPQKKANGKPCGGDGECQSGHCIGRGNNKKCGPKVEHQDDNHDHGDDDDHNHGDHNQAQNKTHPNTPPAKKNKGDKCKESKECERNLLCADKNGNLGPGTCMTEEKQLLKKYSRDFADMD